MSKKLRLPVQGENKFVSKSTANISVIIPAYNRAGLIGETLRSLLNQTVWAKEIIVVDDGSTDGTAEVVERIAEEIEVRRSEIGKERGAGSREQGGEELNVELSLNDPLSAIRNPPSITVNPRIRVIRQENAGPGAARNRGLAEATGEFIHFFDSDDIAAPNKHEVQLRALLKTGADIAYGPWVKGCFAPEEARSVASGELSVASLNSENTRYQLPATLYSGFTPEGPVLQARGLPEGDLIKALLTNWSVIPHACLFRRSILEKAGGFPEDIWVGEDQLLFLRCLLAGAKVVHTPGTMVFYRMGDDPGKLTATGAAQKRHARDWGRFLLKAKKEIENRRSELETTNHTKSHERGEKFSTTDDSDIHGFLKSQQGDAQGTCAGASEPDSLTSKLADSPVSESLTRSASGPAEALRADNAGIGSAGGNQLADSKEVLEGQTQAGLQMDSQKLQSIRTANDTRASKGDSSSVPIRDIRGFHSVVLDPGLSTLGATTPPAEWYAFRLRAYEAWRDLEKFFPDGEGELKRELEGIWRRSAFSGFGFRLSGFLLRKLGGVKLRVLGYREHGLFRCGKFSVFDGESGMAANQKN